MFQKLKIIGTVLTVFATVALSGMTCHAEEIIVNIDELPNLFEDSVIQHDDEDYTYNASGAPLYVYTYVANGERGDFANEHIFDYLVHMYDDGSWANANFSYYGIDATEVASLSEGKVYLTKFSLPAGHYLLEHRDFNNFIRTNVKLTGDNYIFGRKSDGFYYSEFVITDGSYILYPLTMDTDLAGEFSDFLDNEELLLLGQTVASVVEAPEETEEPIIPTIEPVVEIVEATETSEVIESPIFEPVEDKTEQTTDWKVWVIGGLSFAALFILALMFAKKKEK